MKRFFTAVAVASMFAATSSQAIEIEVGYPYAHLFDTTYTKIMKNFAKDHPDIKVKFRATYDDYEDATQVVLREAVSNSLPDVTMQGLNRQLVFVEKGIAKSLEPYIAKEANFEKEGYHKSMLELGTFKGAVHGLPFSVSLPVGYYNMDLMKKAGITKLPTNWDEVIATCKKLRAGGIKNPIFWGWNITGNWFLQALMWSQDTPIIKDGKINLGSPAGLKALETMKAIFQGCKMKNLKWKAALKSFSSGKIAMMYWSTSALGAVERAKGDFTLKTYEFPGLKGWPKGLPAGGNSAMLVSTSKDPKRLEAAWKFLKYITSGVGAAAVAETTGYMPPNKAANEIILKDFYARNPNKQTAVRQLPLLREWIAYPGDKGLAVTQVFYDAMEGILLGDHTDMKKLQAELVEEVNEMLPK
jgi:multiple sugar transport system substrate-binding protein